MLFFKKLFRGSYPLVKTFWLYYVLYSTLILLVAEGISSMFPNAFGAFSYILLGIVQLVYSIVCLHRHLEIRHELQKRRRIDSLGNTGQGLRDFEHHCHHCHVRFHDEHLGQGSAKIPKDGNFLKSAKSGEKDRK